MGTRRREIRLQLCFALRIDGVVIVLARIIENSEPRVAAHLWNCGIPIIDEGFRVVAAEFSVEKNPTACRSALYHVLGLRKGLYRTDFPTAQLFGVSLWRIVERCRTPHSGQSHTVGERGIASRCSFLDVYWNIDQFRWKRSFICSEYKAGIPIDEPGLHRLESSFASQYHS